MYYITLKRLFQSLICFSDRVFDIPHGVSFSLPPSLLTTRDTVALSLYASFLNVLSSPSRKISPMVKYLDFVAIVFNTLFYQIFIVFFSLDLIFRLFPHRIFNAIAYWRLRSGGPLHKECPSIAVPTNPIPPLKIIKFNSFVNHLFVESYSNKEGKKCDCISAARRLNIFLARSADKVTPSYLFNIFH